MKSSTWNIFLLHVLDNDQIKPNIRLGYNDVSTWPIFLLNVYDYNQIKSNVPLGYNYVWLCSAGYIINDTQI